MTLSEQQLSIIEEYIDSTLIDKAKLIDYLEKHRIIKNEVFKKCAKRGKTREWNDEDYCTLLDYPQAYTPVTRDVFIRRIPILFYCSAFGTDGRYRSGLWYVVPKRDKDPDPESLELLYQDLEFMFYGLKLDMQSICHYALEQVSRHVKKKSIKTRGLFPDIPDYSEDEMFGVPGEIDHDELFEMWRHYLKLCFKLGWTDYLPERFLTAYNRALEATGHSPIIYRPLVQYGVQYFGRHGNQYICKGNFPCDSKGRPILRWTTIRVENAKDIRFTGAMSRAGSLIIDLQPDTTIHLLGEENYVDEETEPDDEWHQIYAGPMNMEFDHEALKYYRQQLGMTQKDVADAIGANVRTLQKWESGASEPDGHYLLRIMNWLQIEDVQDLITYRKPAVNDEKEPN